jgi:CBS domain-containing protein
MAKQVRELMNKQPIKMSGRTTVMEAARQMRDADVGAVLVTEDLSDGTRLAGIVTDRDITVRAIGHGLDPSTTVLRDICTSTTTTLGPDDDIERAIAIMRDKAIRRIPVVDDTNRAVGILSLGDLAREREPRSVLGQISAARPTR